jgi:transcriptional regulator with XRE-family HTH domain
MDSGTVFSPHLLGEKLRSLRVRAGLTQAEVAERMGLTGKSSGNVVGHLEQGRARNPSVMTLTLFLRACGALWGEITGILDCLGPVPIDAKAITDSELSPEDKQRLESAIEKQVRKFEVKLAAPVDSKPLHPAQQTEAVRKLKSHRIVATLMEQAVAEVLADKPVVSIEYPRYKAVAREALGMLWKEAKRSQKSTVEGQGRPEDGELRSQKSEGRRQNETEGDFKSQSADYRLQIGGIADRLAEKAEYWGTQKLDAGLVREVQDLVIRRFAALQESNPELFPRA